MGVNVATPQCDVSDVNSLTKALDDCYAKGFPKAKGCIQGSMVLKVKKQLSNTTRRMPANLHIGWAVREYDCGRLLHYGQAQATRFLEPA
jgi:hypothetical protein